MLGAQAIAGALAAGPAPGEEVVFASAEEAGVMANGGAATPRSVAAAAPVAASSAVQTASQGSEFDRVGRNDPCPCGSGKKFKFCHGR